MKRVILAFLIAPAVPLLILGLIDFATPAGGEHRFGNAALFAVIMLLYVYPTTLILGVPAFFFFLRRSWHQWWRILVGGVAIGIAPSFLLAAVSLFVDMGGEELIAAWLPVAGIGAAFGAVSALSFRAIALPFDMSTYRPDGDASQTGAP